MNRLRMIGLGIASLALGLNFEAKGLQVSGDPAGAPSTNIPAFEAPAPQPPPDSEGGAFRNSSLKPLTEGPLHEAFLSPAKDRRPIHTEKAPPASVLERPAVDPPESGAKWIEGYWEWDTARRDFVWVTGTWRVAPPGRFWVNGYWKRDGEGWYRVPGFWSDRRTDRLDYRKSGPPAERPDDDPGEPPDEDTFYIPGQYYPDGDGVVWKKGYWSRAQSGWAWVPAQWVKQPEGWVFQEGFWDRTLEGRGTLFAPASVPNNQADQTGQPPNNDLVYQPYTTVSPELYGQLNGAFGRPNSNYDGYPGVSYDETGRYYGYAGYGTLSGYYGYLDYPFYGGYGYPYIATPVAWGGGIGLAYPYAGYGYGLCGGTLGGLFGFGYGAYPLAMSFGMGLPWYGYGGFGYPNNGYGYGGFGNAAWSYGGGLAFGGFGLGGFGGWGWGFGLGFPMWGGWGWGGYPWWGMGGWGWGGWGWGGWGGGAWCNRYPFNPGRGGWNRHHPGMNGNHHGRGGGGHLAGMGHRGGATGFAGHGSRGVQAPPASRAFGSPYGHNAMAHRAGGTGTSAGHGGHTQGHVGRTSAVANSGNGWHSSYNGAHSGAGHVQRHTAARPAFNHPNHGVAGHQGQGVNHQGIHQGPIGQVGQGHMGNQHAGQGLNHQGLQGGQMLNHAQHAGQALNHASAMQGGQALNHASAMQGTHLNSARAGASSLGTFSSPNHAIGSTGAYHRGGSGFSGAATHPGYGMGRVGGGTLGSGFNGGHVGGGFSGAHMGGGFSGGHMGGMGGGHMGGMGGGHMGGMGGGHGGGGHR